MDFRKYGKKPFKKQPRYFSGKFLDSDYVEIAYAYIRQNDVELEDDFIALG